MSQFRPLLASNPFTYIQTRPARSDIFQKFAGRNPPLQLLDLTEAALAFR
jgi:hypothetical protein